MADIKKTITLPGELKMKPIFELVLKEGERKNVDDHLIVEVVDITEKWLLPNRRAMMRITLNFISDKGTDTLQVTSDEPVFIYGEYNITYLGGWRSEVQLRFEKK